MRVILQRDIPKLGRSGEVVAVKDGYARNYLLPRSLAVAATGGAMKEVQARTAREQERGEKLLTGAQKDAVKLEGLTITIIGKVGSGTKLYGSVTAQDVVEAIKRERGVTVDKRRVGLVDPIKTLGAYTIPVRLHSDVSIPVTVEVTTEADLERRKLEDAKAAAAASAAAAAVPTEAPVVETAPVEEASAPAHAVAEPAEVVSKAEAASDATAAQPAEESADDEAETEEPAE